MNAARPTRAPARFAAVRDLAFRLERRRVRGYGELQLRQLDALRRAYGGGRPPELLVIGDSDMFWTDRRDRDRRHLSALIRDGVDPRWRMQVLAGPSYTGRIVAAFLDVLASLPGRPRLVVVPLAHASVQTVCLAHPLWGYEAIAEAIAAAAGGPVPPSLPRPPAEVWEDHDKMPVPSLVGAARTVGEVRLLMGTPPRTAWQRELAERCTMDYYNAERLTAGSLGVRHTEAMGAAVGRLGLPTVAYVAPVNVELAEERLGPGVREHLSRNGRVMEDTFLEAAGPLARVVDGTFSCPRRDFGDALHFNEAGRLRFGASVAAAARELLAGGRPVQASERIAR